MTRASDTTPETAVGPGTGTALLLDHDELTEAFEYLDDLRESGATNMFGAGIYLRKDLGLDRRVASVVLAAWMDTFDVWPASDRARAALARATPEQQS